VAIARSARAIGARDRRARSARDRLVDRSGVDA
jgi:hypothetical protein